MDLNFFQSRLQKIQHESNNAEMLDLLEGRQRREGVPIGLYDHVCRALFYPHEFACLQTLQTLDRSNDVVYEKVIIGHVLLNLNNIILHHNIYMNIILSRIAGLSRNNFRPKKYIFVDIIITYVGGSPRFCYLPVRSSISRVLEMFVLAREW